MGRSCNVFTTEFAKNFIKNEVKITDKYVLLVKTYKDSYPDSDWYSLSDDEIYSLASKKKNGSTKEIARFRSAVSDISYVTTASIMEELDEARDLAKDQENPSVMITATMSKAKAAGLIVNKVENNNRTNISIEAQIKTVPQDFLMKLADSGAVLPSVDDSDVIDI